MSKIEPKIFLESHKNLFEYFKHITTLDTAAILLMTAFLEKAFEKPQGKIFAVLAFMCFILSLICSVNTMYHIAEAIRKEEFMIFRENYKLKKIIKSVNLLISKYGFVIGMIFLALFGILNILNVPKQWFYY